MKKKDQKDGGLFRKKGFYVALYSCIGVMLLAAAVISFRNLSVITDPLKTANENPVDFSQLEQANANSPRVTIPPAATANPTVKPTVRPASTAKPAATVPPTQRSTTSLATAAPAKNNLGGTAAPATNAPAAASTPNVPAATTTGTPIAPAAATAPAATAAPATVPGTAEASPQEVMGQVEPMFSYFTGDAEMSWPVLGEIVMDYSPQHAIYDKTLDQYRTNDSISIAAPVGTPVKASADGVVISVAKTRRDGNTVTIDNGNGWTTTYGQLMDDVLVSQGDVVKSGQVIGGVGNPSIYNVLLGSHVSMKISKDSKSVDPTALLATRG